MEYVRRAGVVAIVIVAIRPDHRVVARDGDAPAEPVVGHRVTGSELGLLRPRSSGTVEYVRRAGVGATVIVAIRPDHRVVARDGEAAAEEAVRHRVTGNELELIEADTALPSRCQAPDRQRTHGDPSDHGSLSPTGDRRPHKSH